MRSRTVRVVGPVSGAVVHLVREASLALRRVPVLPIVQHDRLADDVLLGLDGEAAVALLLEVGHPCAVAIV